MVVVVVVVVVVAAVVVVESTIVVSETVVSGTVVSGTVVFGTVVSGTVVGVEGVVGGGGDVERAASGRVSVATDEVHAANVTDPASTSQTRRRLLDGAGMRRRFINTRPGRRGRG
ncbi:MAG: hypothetical protein ABJH68_12385 [Ilumatobacter sp.]|uniref:hypothetical protein n=1 Tax=Ilumatobacter sp. TaxID=1967498 RepID=UPI00329A43EB